MKLESCVSCAASVGPAPGYYGSVLAHASTCEIDVHAERKKRHWPPAQSAHRASNDQVFECTCTQVEIRKLTHIS